MSSHNQEIKISRTTLKIMYFSLVWPHPSEEMSPSKWYYIRVATFFSLTSVWAGSVIMHFIQAVRTNSGLHISQDLAFIVAFCGLFYILFIYVKNQPKVARLLRDLSNFEKFGTPPGFDEEEKKLTFWSKIWLLYSVVGVIIYDLMSLSQKAQCERMNKERGYNEICGMFNPIWLPFAVDVFPVFHLVHLYVFVCAQIVLKQSLIVSYNIFEIIHHLNLRINHLALMFAECFDERDYEISRNKLRRCIEYHWDILNLAERIDKCFSNAMFVHLTMTAAICGCMEKQFVDGDNPIGAMIHDFGWIMALFLACTGGQHLIDASNAISTAIYFSKWYEADVRLQKDVLFILARSQIDFHMSAGPFSVMSFPLFVSVLKMSYSILAVLTS